MKLGLGLQFWRPLPKSNPPNPMPPQQDLQVASDPTPTAKATQS